jgi:putative membrane protein
VMGGLGFLILFGLILYAWYIKAYIRRYYYDANDNFVTIKKGVFAPAEIHVQYPKIQDVYVDQDILDRMMGLYDVHLASATIGSAMEAHIDGVEQPAAEGLKALLLGRLQSGAGSTNAGIPNSAGPTGPLPPVSVTLSEDVSSKSYPLSGAWLAQNLITYFFSALFISILITFYISGQSTNLDGSILGLSPIAAWFWIFVIIFACHIVWTFAWRSTYYFEFLPEYILMRSGIIARSEVHVPYRAVQDVLVTQGIIERMFGLATVNIQNAAAPQMVGRRLNKSGVIIPGQPLQKANHLAEITRSVTLTKNTSQTGL